MPEVHLPCRFSTDYEIERGEHMTPNEDGVCDRCVRVQETFAARRREAELPTVTDEV